MYRNRVPLPKAWAILGAHLLVLICCLSPLYADTGEVTLRVPAFEDGRHHYFHDLLRQSLAALGHELHIDPVWELPQTRREADLAEGVWADIDWYVRTDERDSLFRHTELALTDGLIGHRVFLIRPEDEELYAEIATIEDLADTGLVAGMGQGWYDYQVWTSNGLPVTQTAHPGNLYQMVALGDRGVDYFPRGIAEAVIEAPSHPYLAVEPRLMLIYDRSSRFYFSDAVSDATVSLIDDALQRAAASGLRRELLREYFGGVYDELGFDTRHRIYLQTP